MRHDTLGDARKQVLDRLLDRDDAVAPGQVEFVDQHGQRRCLAGARDTRHQNQAIPESGQPIGQLRGKTGPGKIWNLRGNDPEAGPHMLAIKEIVRAEPLRLGVQRHSERKVGVLLVPEPLGIRRGAGRQEQRLQAFCCEFRFVERLQDAVHAQHGWMAYDQMEIGRLAMHGQGQPLSQRFRASWFVWFHSVP